MRRVFDERGTRRQAAKGGLQLDEIWAREHPDRHAKRCAYRIQAVCGRKFGT
nr:hypothetical protein [Bradyrhizobium zhanjiangense]